MNIFTNDGLLGLKNLLDKDDSVLKIQNGEKIDIFSSQLEQVKAPNLPENPPSLILPSKESSYDAENAIELHKYFKTLSPRVACGPNLWVSLGFIYHQDYLLSRWKIKSQEEPRAKINDRYFLKVGRVNYFRNAISRLWWTAHMTYDETQDPAKAYELTNLVFEIQEYQWQIMLRKYGSSADVCRRVLRHFYNNKLDYQERATPQSSYINFIKHVGAKLNLYSAVYLLDLVSEKKLNDFISREADAFFIQK